MEPKSLVLILARDLAEKIASAMFLIDHEGALVFFNEPAEEILGRTFAAVGRMELDDWLKAFEPVGPDGEALAAEELPIVRALRERQPAHRRLRITGMDGESRVIAATAFPLFARTDDLVGAAAIFWEVPPEGPHGEGD